MRYLTVESNYKLPCLTENSNITVVYHSGIIYLLSILLFVFEFQLLRIYFNKQLLINKSYIF